MKFAAACAGVLAAAAPATAPTDARAADECLTAPKSTTPAGAHWYYRLEKGTKRKCWYLADEVSKATRTTSSAATPAASSSEPSNPPAAKPRIARQSVADARAELTTPEDDQPALAATTWPPLDSSAEITAVPADTSPTAADEPPASNSWTMAARWPAPNAGGAEGSPPDEQTATALRATAAPQEATADPLRIVLIVLTAALLAAAVGGRLLLRKARHTPRRTRPRTIWPDERSDDPIVSVTRRVHSTRTSLDTQQPSADVEEIEALLRASRSATG